MNHNFVYAVPLLIICILLEYLWSRYIGKHLYNITPTLVSLSCAIMERMTELGIFALMYAVYIYVDKLIPYNIPENIYTFLLLLVFGDFCWYWYHRSSHRINLFWAIHVVHHQSEDYNFVTGLRVTGLQSILRIIFWLPMPLAGFSAQQVILIIAVLAVYQFFMHTQVIGRVRFLENWIVTPAHHRVHHATNPAYIDKNYAGLFAFWDRIFGSLTYEEEEPKYGITTPLQRTDIVAVHFHHFYDIFEALRQSKSWSERWSILFGGPEKMKYETIKTHNQLTNKYSKKDFMLFVSIMILNTILMTIVYLYEFSLPITLLIIVFSFISLWQMTVKMEY